MIRIRTPVKQYAYTGLSEILTPMKRNLQRGAVQSLGGPFTMAKQKKTHSQSRNDVNAP